MHSYKLREETRPTLWNVASPLFGLILLAALIWVAPALLSWWGMLGTALVAGVALSLLLRTLRAAALEDRES